MNDDAPSAEPTTLILYGTLGCHLCEQAEWLLQPLLQSTTWRLQHCDIAEQPDSETLIARYGLRIPVLRFGTVELDWPFDLMQVQTWLAQQNHCRHS
jgi:hypothetical protein